MPIQRIAGCAAAFETFARDSLPIHRRAEGLPKLRFIQTPNKEISTGFVCKAIGLKSPQQCNTMIVFGSFR